MMMMMTMMMITMMSIGRWKDKRFQNSSPTNNDDRTERWKDNAERSRKSNCMASGCKEEILIDFVDFVQKNYWLPCLVDNVLSMGMSMSMGWVWLVGWVGTWVRLGWVCLSSTECWSRRLSYWKIPESKTSTKNGAWQQKARSQGWPRIWIQAPVLSINPVDTFWFQLYFILTPIDSPLHQFLHHHVITQKPSDV